MTSGVSKKVGDRRAFMAPRSWTPTSCKIPRLLCQEIFTKFLFCVEGVDQKASRLPGGNKVTVLCKTGGCINSSAGTSKLHSRTSSLL